MRSRSKIAGSIEISTMARRVSRYPRPLYETANASTAGGMAAMPTYCTAPHSLMPARVVLESSNA